MAKPKPSRIAIKDSKFLETARRRYKAADESDTQQCERERDDIAFEDGQQWPADIQIARQGQQAIKGMPAVPARPTLVINKIKEPIRQILNQERAADIGIEIVPADDFGDLNVTPDDTEIKVREGLVRRIQRESHAGDARTWAFKRAVIAGRGYYLVMTRYLPGKTADQEIYIHRIYNQESVKGDPSRVQPDGSDAEYWFIGTWVPWDRFKSEYPYLSDGKENPLSEYGANDFISMQEQYPQWYKTSDSKERSVRVVDYWYVERAPKTLLMLKDGTAQWDGEGDAPDADDIADTRTVLERTIKFCKIGGGVVKLEETDWAGPDMPVIQVIGDEVLPYDEQKRFEGMVRQSRDAQQGYNYMVSKQVEVVGLTPIPPLHVDPDAIDGFEEWYKAANTRALPYLPSRTYDDQGRQLAEPHRPAIDPNILPIAQSIALFDMGIKSTTAVPDPTLGNVDPTLKSARAIKEVTANAAQSTTNFMDNLARSIAYEGKVVNNLLYPIYGARPGRLVRILTGEGKPDEHMIGAPAADAALTARQQAAKRATLTQDAQFNVIVKVTKSFESKRQQEAALGASLIDSNPEFMTWFGDIFLANTDGPGHQQMAERARVMLAPPIQAMLEAQQQGGTFDPIAQQKVAALTQQLQHAEAAMSQLADEAKSKKIDAQSKIDVENIRQSAETQRLEMEQKQAILLQKMKSDAEETVARINAETKGIISRQTALDEAISQDTDNAHDVAMSGLEQQHQKELATMQGQQAQAAQQNQQAHEAAMGAMQADQQAQAEPAEGAS